MLMFLIFAGMQFVPTPAVSKTAAAGPHTAEIINPRVGRILERSCQDCHSSRTVWPWYSRIAPISWYISKHVIEGREVLDFSEWANRPPSDNERALICDAVSDGSMPLGEYTAIHRNAKLSKQDVASFCAWASAPEVPLGATQVGSLTKNK